MQQRNDDLPPDLRHRAFFLETCRRTTEAVAKAIEDARFEDTEWVERWDVVVFADLVPCGSRRRRRAPRRGRGQVLHRLAVAGFGVSLPPS